MADDKDATPDKHWHLDKRVPVVLIFAILLQTATAVWWASAQSERVSALERAEAARAAIAPVAADRLTRVEVNVENIKAGVEEIKRLIQRAPN